MRVWIEAAVAVAVLGFAVLLLWPVDQGDRWRITEPADRIQGKEQYLEAVSRRSAARARSEKRMPNVLLIVADDLGRHDVSAYGAGPAIATPHIDSLAADGLRFVNGYATAAICAPSRAALLTGRYQNRFGFESQPMMRYVRNLGEYLGFRYLIDTDAMQPFLLDAYPSAADRARQGLPPSEITLGEVFRAAGYRTAIFGKWHLGYSPDNGPDSFGFDTYYGFREAFSLYAPEDDPTIVNIHQDLFWERHIWRMGRTGPSAIVRDGVVVDESRYLTDAIRAEAAQFMSNALDVGTPFLAYVSFSAPHTPFQARADDVDAIEGARDDNERVYAAMIRRLDHAVGELVDLLRARGALDHTLVVFTSDNGGAAYTGATDNGPLRGGKFTQFEGGLAVPLVVKAPGGPVAEVVDTPVLLTDIFATLLAQLGLPLPVGRDYDSWDLLTLAALPQRRLFWRSDFNYAVRDGRWKLLRNDRDATLMLFDLVADPGERDDVAATHPQIVGDLNAALEDWVAGLEAPRWPRVMNYRYEDSAGAYWFAI